MLIIGCDYHPGFQQIAFVDTETGGNPTSGLMVGTLSPSGDRVAVARARGTGSDIWMYSLKTALGTRLTFTDDFNESPVWSPDSDNIVFTRNLTDHYELRLKSVS